jgi:hypothetical protein
LYKSIADRQVVIDQVERELLQKRDSLKLLLIEKDQSQEDVNGLMQQKTLLSLQVDDLFRTADEDEQNRQKLLNERDVINEQITEKQIGMAL